MREPNNEWLAALRALTGHEQDTIRYNSTVHRWEFVLAGADGRPQSQFWGVFHDPVTGAKLEPDEATGLYAFRELDDAGMREALHNLTVTFVANPFDGAGTVRRQALRRMRQNRATRKKQLQDAGAAWADMFVERHRRIRGALQLSVPGTVADRLTPQPRHP